MSVILNILNNLIGFGKSWFDKKVKMDPGEAKRLQHEKADVKVAEYNQQEIKEMYNYIKKHRKLMWKAKGVKYGLFKKKPPLIGKNETIESVYFDLKDQLEDK